MFSDTDLSTIVEKAGGVIDEAERWRYLAAARNDDADEVARARQGCMLLLQDLWFAVERWSISGARDVHRALLERRDRRLLQGVERFEAAARRAMAGLRSRAIDAGEIAPDWSVVDDLQGATKKLRFTIEHGPEEQWLTPSEAVLIAKKLGAAKMGLDAIRRRADDGSLMRRASATPGASYEVEAGSLVRYLLREQRPLIVPRG